MSGALVSLGDMMKWATIDLHCVSKRSYFMFDNNFGKCGPFSKFFYQLIREKILYVYAQELPSHLQYIATLPCET